MKDYKECRLYAGKNSEWYVEYYYRTPGTNQFKRFKERFDLGRFRAVHGTTLAREYGREAVKFMNEKLKNGFSPYKVVRRDKAPLPRVTEVLAGIRDCLDKDATKDMKREHLGIYNRLARFITDYGMESKFMAELTYADGEKFREDLLKKYKLSAKTINGALTYASLFWKKGVRDGNAGYDIFANVRRVKIDQAETDKERFEPFTKNEIESILNFLRSKNQHDFIRFVLFIYYAWARPIEITRLRVEDINLKDDLIRFRKGQTKNGRPAFVQIVPPLKRLLLEMELEKYPPDYYLFSKDGNGFLPGKNMLGKNSTSERWKYWIKERLNLDKDMYGLKHTGNIDYLLKNKDNTNLKWQQMQNRHSSAAMTERYVKKLGAFFIEVGDVNFNDFS